MESIKLVTSFASHRGTKRPHPDFEDKISDMKLKLAPIWPLPRGAPHPAYPKTMLHFHVLTEAQLDAMADYYSQSARNEWTDQYPCPMNWDPGFFAELAGDEAARVRVKRRKLGKFIGLRGCETPVDEVEMRIKAIEAKVAREIEQEKERQRAAEKGWMK